MVIEIVTSLTKYISQLESLIDSLEKLEDKSENEFYKLQIANMIAIKTTGSMEKYFDEMMKNYAFLMSSNIFHNYFTNHFTSKGRQVDPNKVNGVFQNIGIDSIEKSNIRVEARKYESVDELYKIRVEIAHGGSVQDTYTDIIEKSKISSSFMFDQIEKKIEKSLNENGITNF